ncbi:MAG: hypothetical protein HEQ29_21980 [Dolichospermum sp. LBC05a]|nr:hypothetical protein [Dolichospermum sp. OL01]MCO5799298.1 hypothetical protein [Dolichospermum sp. OL03]MCS6283116.1 hypothetical protein [Dolichospermum sp.]QSV60660.1 MAG: hypothetical protein HEQ29_21980 [Dolichospermum sp. LBC05a]
MGHTFLLEPGRWVIQGSWLERNSPPIPLKGLILVVWNRDSWFSMATKLIFPNSDRPEISFQYKGRLHDGESQYNFSLRHNLLGQVEGEGWIGRDTIVQRYLALGDSSADLRNRQRRSGFETLHQLNDNHYYLTSGILVGHFLDSTMEANLQRQPQ